LQGGYAVANDGSVPDHSGFVGVFFASAASTTGNAAKSRSDEEVTGGHQLHRRRRRECLFQPVSSAWHSG